MMQYWRQTGLFVFVFFFLSSFSVWAGNNTVAGAFRSYVTLYSIGIEWDITGDDDHDASCDVHYRKQGSGMWREALPLYLVDYLPPAPQHGIDKRFNGFAGSVLFLEPGQSYEIQLELVDPDGGAVSRNEIIVTRAYPTKPTGGHTLHVVPGSGGGNGSALHPFLGIETAQDGARTGDVFLLHAGYYHGFDSGGEIQFNIGGNKDAYIVWQAAGDGDVVFDDPVRIAADFIWLEGVHVQGHAGVDNEFGLRTYNAPKNVVIVNNRFTDFYNSIALNHGGENWLIADNTIIGDKDVVNEPDGPSSWGGEGIELEFTGGHTIAYNSISRVADGISSPLHDTDIFGNDIFDVTDDGIEPDYGYANIRVWQNRISNARHNGFSFQPMNSGPWYFIRNQVAAPLESCLKIRQTSRVLLAHNIFVGWNNALGNKPASVPGILTFESKNNLWISMDNQYVWVQYLDGIDPDWRTSLDYDGFDWGNAAYGFKWGPNSRYHDLQEFQAATGLQFHAVHIDRDTCFTAFNVPAAPPQPMPMQYMTLQQQSCNAVDAGVLLANINDHFSGSAPDLGPYERGAPLPHYGPWRGGGGHGDRPDGICIPPLVHLLLKH